jgi:adenylate kinase family enzyme
MKTLIMMVGLPRSGKSTQAQEISYKLGCPIVNRDSVRLALHGMRFLPEAEQMVAAIVKIMVKALFLAGHSNIVLDECNQTVKRRREWFSDNWSTEFVYIDTPVEICQQRAIETGQEDLIPVITRMAKEFDYEPEHPFGLDWCRS